MSFFSRLIPFIVFVTTGAPSYAFIMGSDDRQFLTDHEQNIAVIRQTGRVIIAAEGFVSGVLTGDNCDVVISAGHAAIYWRTVEHKGWMRGAVRADGKFFFALRAGLEQAPIPMRLIKSGFENVDNIGKDEYDWSVFRLMRPGMQHCAVLPLLQSSLNCRGQLMMPAYHFDGREMMLVDRTCDIKGHVKEGVIVHNCDSKDGSSGAPLVCQSGERSAIIGFNVSGVTAKRHYDPGEHGVEGRDFHYRNHKNLAVAIHGQFARELKKELQRSGERRARQDPKKP